LVEFRDASLQGYDLRSRGIELREFSEVAVGRIIEMMARKELGCEEDFMCDLK
jgi:hypothetical protein